MKTIPHKSVRAIGEAMVEMAPVGAGTYQRGFAGDTFNTVWHLAQWLGDGADAGMITRVGQDALSDAFVAEMATDGLVCTGVQRDAVLQMGLYLIALNGVERSFHYWRSASAARHLADDGGVLAAALAGVGLVHLSGITLAILPPAAREVLFAALATLRARGVVVSFDPNIRPRLWQSADEIRQTVTQMLALTDIALPSLDDEMTHFGDRSAHDTIRRMVGAGVGEVVVKNGAGPVSIWCDGSHADITTQPVTDIRDTTGAGDAFNAGYLAARVIGASQTRSVAAGQAMAATVLTHFGARAAKPAVAALPALHTFL